MRLKRAREGRPTTSEVTVSLHNFGALRSIRPTGLHEPVPHTAPERDGHTGPHQDHRQKLRVCQKRNRLVWCHRIEVSTLLKQISESGVMLQLDRHHLARPRLSEAIPYRLKALYNIRFGARHVFGLRGIRREIE